MSDKRIIDLEAKQTLGSGDYLAADSAQGTYKVDANTNIMTPLANVRNNVANSSASPDKYSTSTAYKVGDMVIHDDILYKCTTACSAASWAVNSACFTAKTLASVVTQLNNDLSVQEITSQCGMHTLIATYTHVYKLGNIVMIVLVADSAITASTDYYEFFSLPANYIIYNNRIAYFSNSGTSSFCDLACRGNKITIRSSGAKIQGTGSIFLLTSQV